MTPQNGCECVYIAADSENLPQTSKLIGNFNHLLTTNRKKQPILIYFAHNLKLNWHKLLFCFLSLFFYPFAKHF